MEIKKSSLFTSTGLWRQFNGFYFTLGAISSHSWPSVTRGWKWHLVRDKNHFIFFTPVTVNKYSFLLENKFLFFPVGIPTGKKRNLFSSWLENKFLVGIPTRIYYFEIHYIVNQSRGCHRYPASATLSSMPGCGVHWPKPSEWYPRLFNHIVVWRSVLSYEVQTSAGFHQ